MLYFRRLKVKTEVKKSMKIDRGPVPIDFARELVDEVLAVASQKAADDERAEFLEELEAVHSIEIVDIREQRLEAFDLHWMDRFRASDVLERLLAAHPGIADVISDCALKLARTKADERAYLDAEERDPVALNAKPRLVLRLTADTLLASDRLEPLVSATLSRARRRS